jgi:hypothetical protein
VDLAWELFKTWDIRLVAGIDVRTASERTSPERPGFGFRKPT